VPVRIIEAKHALPPFLPFDRMDQLHMRRDTFESCVDIIVLEIEE
jgi:hypothetical protein